ncbi:MAG TPA: glycosyltransferase [Polyangiaceae bacterium]|nr:glycosyltransferase [Polyangiaceae bacterium]
MSALPSVTVICANASTNGMGRALLLAKLLATETTVRIAGVSSKETIWMPARDSGIPIAAFPVPPRAFDYARAIPWIREQVGDDLVVVSKPVFQSLGLALSSGLGRRGFVVDIDDWETGLIQRDFHTEGMSGVRQTAARALSYAARGGVNRFTAAALLEAYARHARHRIVSNRWLAARFGGEILYHVRDPAELDPSLPPAHAVTPLPDGATWVGFVGTPRPHKGIDVLVDAVASARRHADVGLAIMGIADTNDPIVVRARQLLGAERFVTYPQFPFSALADHLRLLDIVAVPSLDVPAAWGQIPAKLFDGMAMAKPVVASALNDIPEILEGAGFVVKAGHVASLADALVRLAVDPDLRVRLGRTARTRLVERYSYDAGRPVLVRAVQNAAK